MPVLGSEKLPDGSPCCRPLPVLVVSVPHGGHQDPWDPEATSPSAASPADLQPCCPGPSSVCVSQESAGAPGGGPLFTESPGAAPGAKQVLTQQPWARLQRMKCEQAPKLRAAHLYPRASSHADTGRVPVALKNGYMYFFVVFEGFPGSETCHRCGPTTLHECEMAEYVPLCVAWWPTLHAVLLAVPKAPGDAWLMLLRHLLTGHGGVPVGTVLPRVPSREPRACPAVPLPWGPFTCTSVSAARLPILAPCHAPSVRLGSLFLPFSLLGGYLRPPGLGST